MKRRSKSGAGAANAPRRAAATAAKRRYAGTPARRRAASAVGRQKEVERLSRELNEAAERQRASAQMLRLINSSSGDPKPVFEGILAGAVRICDAHFGAVNRWDGDALQLIATHNMPSRYVELRRQTPYRSEQHSASGRMLARKRPVHIVDLAKERAYLDGNPATVAAVELAGVRTVLAVPMWKEHELVGSFSLGRKQVRPFTERQIEIVQDFAAQAVVAVENSRLFQELREAVQQQAAAGDVLKIISRAPFELQTVLDKLLELAVRLCDADLGALHPNRANFRTFAIYGGPASHKDVARTVLFEPDDGSVMGRTAQEGKPVQVADVLADPHYRLQQAQLALGYRTVLGVPLLREGIPIGVIVLMRSTVRPFTDKQIGLVQNFAAQAVIAIENMRLLTELRERTDELGRSIKELHRERNNKLMNLEAMAAAISHEIRQPLASIAANGGAALRFLGHAPPNLVEVRSALHRMVGDSHRASQVFDNIRALFGKADVAREPVDVAELVHGVLHGLRRDLQDRRITLAVTLAPNLPTVIGHRGQLHEVLLNLVRNAIEAMDFVEDGVRTLKVSAQPHGANEVSVAVEDSGPGIDPKQLKTIFDAFVTTKSHGMGLGLALCRMIVERHAGQLSALPVQPRGSIFRVVLPSGRPPAAEATVS